MEKKEIPPKVLGAAICITRVFTDAIAREDQRAGVPSYSAGSCWERVCLDGDKVQSWPWRSVIVVLALSQLYTFLGFEPSCVMPT